jgi:hypothetical protein
VGDGINFGDGPAQPYIMQFRFSEFSIFTFFTIQQTTIEAGSAATRSDRIVGRDESGHSASLRSRLLFINRHFDRSEAQGERSRNDD